MSLIDLMKARYSVRQYQSTPVEEEKLMAVLEAGRVAPTAANRQPQRKALGLYRHFFFLLFSAG